MGEAAWAITFVLTAIGGFTILVATPSLAPLDMIDKLGPTLTSAGAIAAAFWAARRAWDAAQAQIEANERFHRTAALKRNTDILLAVAVDLRFIASALDSGVWSLQRAVVAGEYINRYHSEVFEIDGRLGIVLNFFRNDFGNLKIGNAAVGESPSDVIKKYAAKAVVIAQAMDNVRERLFQDGTITSPFVDMGTLEDAFYSRSVALDEESYIVMLTED
ncbi:hypothetical protein OSH08_05600 [Kaistia geumhonensis]|uniref:Acylesterase/phospholipase RssA n=1 Tax=Kaistia geumhonensis TaxID=410839 RepID=A0ABU0M5R9_9HYPH|nr:hypothetical protein [Kaistia geumhonensis]MCX5478468.1 hypothetical protein [Kaistia geumhonensis]MDQ0516314.1 putative acylesterase/phospholipase RssA [Kaistia geumhonensis]